MVRAWATVLAVIAAGLIAAPLAVAHVAEDPIEVETEVLQDEGDDSFYFYDGYDLYNLFVREAYMPDLDEEGLIFRFTIYGGFGPEHLADALHIDLGVEGGTPLRLSTSDDEAWTGDLRIIALNITPDAPPYNGYTTKVQAFAPYDALGAAPGGTLGPLMMWSYAGDDLRDVAPGTTFVPGSMGMVPTPPVQDSVRLVEAIELQGAVGYVERTLAADANTVVVNVVNPFAETGQHVHLAPVPTPGWEFAAQGPEAVSLDGGEEGALALNVTASPDATAPLRVAILTDTGGREWFYVGVDGETLLVSDTSEVGVDPATPKESPGAGAALLLLASLTAGVVLARRR